MIELYERIRDSLRLNKRWGFPMKQAWKMTSPRYSIRVGKQ